MIDFEFEFQYAEAKLPILRQVGGGIPAGRCVVLCGGSGCGKSTLLRCINGLIPQFYEGELRGFCRLNGQDTAGLRIGEIGELAASVFQDPRSQFFTVNSSNEVAFGLENHGLPQDKIRRRVDEAFRIFHLERLKDRNVYELSSGERQLISILSAWAMDTDIFLLDEPTANLDFAATQQLKEILLALKKQGKTLLLSEHRLYYLADRPGFSFPASKSDLYNLHLHHSVNDFGIAQFEVKKDKRYLATVKIKPFGTSSTGVKESDRVKATTKELEKGVYIMEITAEPGEYCIIFNSMGTGGYSGTFDFGID